MVRDAVEGKKAGQRQGLLQPPTFSIASPWEATYPSPHINIWPRHQVVCYKLESIGSEIPREIIVKLPFLFINPKQVTPNQRVFVSHLHTSSLKFTKNRESK